MPPAFPATVDALGVLMAGLQALHAESRVLRERIEELEGRALLDILDR